MVIWNFLWPTCYFNQYTGLTHLIIDILPIVRDFWFFYSERTIFTEKWRKWVKNYKNHMIVTKCLQRSKNIYGIIYPSIQHHHSAKHTMPHLVRPVSATFRKKVQLSFFCPLLTCQYNFHTYPITRPTRAKIFKIDFFGEIWSKVSYNTKK
jgi:hypothetical protein